jgi:hypothetical protein
MDQKLDNWTNYISFRWIDDPDPSPARPMSDSPKLIPDSEPSSSAAASGEETGNNEEDLASVPSTVQVGLHGSSGREGTQALSGPKGNLEKLGWKLELHDFQL